VLKSGVTEDEIGLKAYRAKIVEAFGGQDKVLPWYWSYRVRFGVKSLE
jgi:hypothetical protein